MKAQNERYQELERMLTVFVFAALAMFVGYLGCAIAGQSILKIVFAVLAILISGFGLWILGVNKELTHHRSLWITSSFCSITLCIIVSLFCQFP